MTSEHDKQVEKLADLLQRARQRAASTTDIELALSIVDPSTTVGDFLKVWNGRVKPLAADARRELSELIDEYNKVAGADSKS